MLPCTPNPPTRVTAPVVVDVLCAVFVDTTNPLILTSDTVDVDTTDNEGFEDTASDLLKIHSSKIDNFGCNSAIWRISKRFFSPPEKPELRGLLSIS